MGQWVSIFLGDSVDGAVVNAHSQAGNFLWYEEYWGAVMAAARAYPSIPKCFI
jgi:hypothetical protein